jgi:transcription initiation factor TFIIIB Brf1 subunit/transcription initiation factor TFIIB
MARGTNEREQKQRVAYGEARRRYADAKSALEFAEDEYRRACAALALAEVEEEAVAELEREMDRLAAAIRREKAALSWLWEEIGPVGTGAMSPVAFG